MNEKSLLMKNEIRIIARYRALMISRYYFIVSLSLITIYLSILKLAPISFYILITLAVLPSILEYIILDHLKNHKTQYLNNIASEQPFCLSTLKKKYHYTRISYFTNSITYLFVLFFICLWQINYSLYAEYGPIASKLPYITLISGLTLRFLAVIIYKGKLPYDLSSNRL